MAFDISAYVSVGAWDADEEEEEEDDLPPPPPPVKTKKGSKKSNSDSGNYSFVYILTNVWKKFRFNTNPLNLSGVSRISCPSRSQF